MSSLLTRDDFQFVPRAGFVQLPIAPGANVYKAPGPNKVIHYRNAKRKAFFDANADRIQQSVERGNLIHKTVQDDLTSALPAYVAHTISNEVFCYADFGNQMRIMPVLGFCDSIAQLLDGRIAVLEFKTKKGKNYNPITLYGYKMQLSVYYSMLRIFYPWLKLDVATLVIFFEEGDEPEIFELSLPEIADNMQSFKTLARAYFTQFNWTGKTTYV